MKRFWVSWWSGNYADEGCTKPPFKFWVSGQKERVGYGLTNLQLEEFHKLKNDDECDAYLDENSKDDCSICAVIDADSEADIWVTVLKHFPDYVLRFCDETAPDFTPSNRFQ